MTPGESRDNSKTIIALAAMGGDFAPDQIVMGAAAVASRELNVSLVGRPDEIERCLASADPAAREHLQIVEALEVIGFDEDPVKAVRAKSDSSMVVACREVAEGRADGVVSAGNTGAMLAAARFNLKRR
mgnify:FL=1